jgi:hypothetical protein
LARCVVCLTVFVTELRARGSVTTNAPFDLGDDSISVLFGVVQYVVV